MLVYRGAYLMAGGALSGAKILSPLQTLAPGLGKKLDVLQVFNKKDSGSEAPPPVSTPVPPPTPTPPPERDSLAAAAAADKERKEALKRRGRKASILNSAQGVTEDAPLGRPAASSGAATLG